MATSGWGITRIVGHCARYAALAALLVGGTAASLLAQRRSGTISSEPSVQMATLTDTLNPIAVVNYAESLLLENPRRARQLYERAVALDPTMPEALDGLRVAITIEDARFLRGYYRGRRRALRDPRAQLVDSLNRRANRLDALLYPRHSKTLLLALIRIDAPRATETTVDMAMFRQPPLPRARWAFASGDVEAADTYFNKALEDGGDTALIRLERGLMRAALVPFIESAQLVDSALADLAAVRDAITARRAEDTDEISFFHSVPAHHHRMGLLLARRGDHAAARAAFGDALLEDLSYFPSHFALAELAMQANDTVTALAESALAAELAPAEPKVHLQRGDVLMWTGQYADAAASFERAASLAPRFALAYYRMADALDAAGQATAALGAYRVFLTLAYAEHPMRGVATQRIEALERPAAQKPPSASPSPGNTGRMDANPEISKTSRTL